MKTITEFSSTALRLANEKLQELQRSQPEAPAPAAAEAPAEGEAQPAAEAKPEGGGINAALAAALKMDEAKVEFLMHALKLSSGFRGNLKRVLVMSLNENDSVPAGAQKIGEHHFVVELIGGPVSQAPRVEEDRGGRRGGKGGKRGGDRGGRGGERGRGGPGGDKPKGPVALPKPRA